MNKQNYIGFELAKKLFENGCDINIKDSDRFEWCNSKDILKTEFVKYESINRYRIMKNGTYDTYTAYSYYDILVTHADKFFSIDNMHMTSDILWSLQEGGERTDKSIWKHCKFNPENKEEG